MKNLEKLVSEHGEALMRLLVSILGPGPDAEDAWQETWLSIQRSMRRIKKPKATASYLRRIATNKAIDLLRRRDRSPDFLQEEPLARLPRDGTELDLACLPENERVCMALFLREGLSLAEIAAAVDSPLGTIKTWMHRGRARLRRRMLEQKEAP